MSNAGFIEDRVQLIGSIETLLGEMRANAAKVQDTGTVQQLLQQAEQQFTATEEALRVFTEQRHALLATIQQIQTELAVAGRPVTGEIS
jgi:hypothetical protein